MPNDQKETFFTVVVTLDFEPEHRGTVLESSQTMGDLFAQQPGFVSMKVHLNHDGNQLLTYLEWTNRASHEACQNAPQVQASGASIMGLLQSGQVRMSVQTYDVISSRSAA